MALNRSLTTHVGYGTHRSRDILRCLPESMATAAAFLFVVWCLI